MVVPGSAFHPASQQPTQNMQLNGQHLNVSTGASSSQIQAVKPEKKRKSRAKKKAASVKKTKPTPAPKPPMSKEDKERAAIRQRLLANASVVYAPPVKRVKVSPSRKRVADKPSGEAQPSAASKIKTKAGKNKTDGSPTGKDATVEGKTRERKTRKRSSKGTKDKAKDKAKRQRASKTTSASGKNGKSSRKRPVKATASIANRLLSPIKREGLQYDSSLEFDLAGFEMELSTSATPSPSPFKATPSPSPTPSPRTQRSPEQKGANGEVKGGTPPSKCPIQRTIDFSGAGGAHALVSESKEVEAEQAHGKMQALSAQPTSMGSVNSVSSMGSMEADMADAAGAGPHCLLDIGLASRVMTPPRPRRLKPRTLTSAPSDNDENVPPTGAKKTLNEKTLSIVSEHITPLAQVGTKRRTFVARKEHCDVEKVKVRSLSNGVSGSPSKHTNGQTGRSTPLEPDSNSNGSVSNSSDSEINITSSIPSSPFTPTKKLPSAIDLDPPFSPYHASPIKITDSYGNLDPRLDALLEKNDNDPVKFLSCSDTLN